MKTYQPFKGFNPFTDEVPYFPYTKLSDVVWKARQILQNRNIGDIDIIENEIQHRIDEYFEVSKLNAIEQLKEDERWEFFEFDSHGVMLGFNTDFEDELQIRTRYDTSDLEALDEIIDQFDNPLEPGTIAPKPQEYFAVLALSKAADAINDIKHSNDVRAGKAPKASGLVPRDYVSAGRHAIEAMEALGRAERARSEESYKNLIASEKKSSASIKAAEKRLNDENEERKNKNHAHAKKMSAASLKKRNAARDAVLARWDAKPELQILSNAKAGINLSDWLSSQNQKLEYHEPRTVSEWISEHKKAIGFTKPKYVRSA